MINLHVIQLLNGWNNFVNVTSFSGRHSWMTLLLLDYLHRYPHYWSAYSLDMLHVSDVPVPSACAILVCLFMLQHYGTHNIAFMFAPIISIWLLFISAVGIYNMFYWNKKIILAISPVYMYRFAQNIGVKSWRSLGSIILCLAGWF